MENYVVMILFFVGTLIPTLITLWLNEKVKGSVKSSFDEKLEIIKKEHSKELSRFQIEINHLKSRENFKFTKLHEKRLTVLEKTNHYIVEISESLKVYVNPLKFSFVGKTNNEAEKILKDDFINKIDEFALYFKLNCIYFDEVIEKLLEDFFKESLLIFATYGRNELVKDELHSLKKIQENLQPIKKQIEMKFRELLGD